MQTTLTPVRRNWSGQAWVMLTQDDLATELQQAREEGRDLSTVDAEFAALRELDLTVEAHQQRAEALLDRIQTLPIVTGYPYEEPSDLPGIQAVRPATLPLPACTLSTDTLLDKALGGWQGRASGCLLGKPVEGKRSWQMEQYLRAQGRWPLSNYFSLTGAPDDVKTACGFNDSRTVLYEDGLVAMQEDDDTNYTVIGQLVVQQHGADFTPDDVASCWLNNLPFYHVCTAERIAYRNLLSCIPAPHSASFRNVYREWIGAQIRADFFGFVNPGNPERAADFAWRDASISHVKNGIYGEMWVAAMLAAAYVCDDVETVIRAGLAQVPAQNRLTAAIMHVIDLYHNGVSYDAAIADLRTRWDENNGHHWCHTISNAEIVVIALLWGERDFERTICYSVMPGFDTDCNGATSGSVLGIILGAARLPAKWIAPMRDTLYTGVAGYHKVSFIRMAQETVALMQG